MKRLILINKPQLWCNRYRARLGWGRSWIRALLWWNQSILS